MLHESDPYEWAKLHFSGAEMSDIRRVERVIKIATAVAQNPGASFGEMFGNWYDVKASYKLFGDEEATPEQLQAGHQWQVKENLKKPGVYALLEDTSDMVWAGREKIAGLGPIGNGSEKLQGFLLHSVLAVKWEDPKPEEGKRPGVEVIGLAHQEYYLRQPRPKKETRQASKQRARESQLWERATQSLGEPPASEWVVWVRICDRGADIYEFMLSCQVIQHQFVVRASQNRCLMDPVTRQRQGYLLSTARTLPSLGTTTLTLRARANQAEREVTLSLAATQITIGAPSRPGIRPDQQPPITCWVVRVWEANPPAGVKPLEWILLTDQPVTCLADALRVMRLYATRWFIEEFHKALKSGLGAERLQLQHAHRLWAAIAIFSVVALRLLDVRELARLFPDAPAQVAGLDPLELDILRLNHPHPIETVRDVILAIGRLGGHLNRTNDGLPGWHTLWRGMLKLRTWVDGVRMAHKLNNFG